MEQRKMLLSIMVVGMLSSAALAIAPMGPPVAGLSQGQYAVGLGYAMSDETVEVSGPFSGSDDELDVERTMYYGCLGYGISNDWNVYAAIGMADAEIDIENTSEDFDGDAEFGFAVGSKRTLYDNGTDTKWGTIFQYCTGETEDKMFGENVELDWYQIQLALGPAVQINEDICLYGGPFLYFLEADVKIENDIAPGVHSYEEFEQAWELGGYIGGLINLGASAQLSIEFLFTGEGWAAGIGAMFPM